MHSAQLQGLCRPSAAFGNAGKAYAGLPGTLQEVRGSKQPQWLAVIVGCPGYLLVLLCPLGPPLARSGQAERSEDLQIFRLQDARC